MHTNYCFGKKKFFLPLVLGLLFWPASFLLAQTESEKGLPFITNYLPKDYKALPQTWSVTEDNRGIMYFGVQNGILEYDGVKWKKVIFKNNPGVVRALAKDKKGIILRLYNTGYQPQSPELKWEKLQPKNIVMMLRT